MLIQNTQNVLDNSKFYLSPSSVEECDDNCGLLACGIISSTPPSYCVDELPKMRLNIDFKDMYNTCYGIPKGTKMA